MLGIYTSKTLTVIITPAARPNENDIAGDVGDYLLKNIINAPIPVDKPAKRLFIKGKNLVIHIVVLETTIVLFFMVIYKCPVLLS